MEFVSVLIVCYVHWTVTCDENAGVLCAPDGTAGIIELEVSKKSFNQFNANDIIMLRVIS